MLLRSTIGMLFLVLGAGQASSQAVPAPDWRGGYFGLTAGTLRTEGAAVLGSHTDDPGLPLISIDIANGLFPQRQEDVEVAPAVGATLGYNARRGDLVGGIELDLMMLSAEADKDFARVDPGDIPEFEGVLTQTRYQTEIDGLATLRLRAGIASGRSLFYGTAGLAAGKIRNRFSLALDDGPFAAAPYRNSWSDSGTRFGFVIGAGFEQWLNETTSFKAEILHFDLEDVTVRAEDPGTFGGNTIAYRFRNEGQVLRLGLNFRF